MTTRSRLIPLILVTVVFGVGSCDAERGRSDGPTPTDGPVSPSPPVHLDLTSCEIDPSAMLVLRFRLRTDGGLSRYPVDATPQIQALKVSGEFAGGSSERLQWTLGDGGDSDAFSLTLSTDQAPAAVTISNITFGLVAPARIHARSLGRLENESFRTGPVAGTITSVQMGQDTVGVEFSLSPLMLTQDLVVMAANDVSLRLGDREYLDEGLSSTRPGESSALHRIVLVGNRTPTVDAGPAQLLVTGPVLQYPSPVTVELPGCESG